MYIVIVNFVIAEPYVAEFEDAIGAQARNSLELESDCGVFDVCRAADKAGNGVFVLYEKYTDSDAFQTHLASDHFKEFDALVAPWTLEKNVTTGQELGAMK